MKNFWKLTGALALVIIASCDKNDDALHQSPGISGYASVQDFLAHNGVKMQYYIVDAAGGGSFTTPQGTVVTIPGNAFVTLFNQPVQGAVVIQFKDIYKKSDMLLSDRPTMLYYGAPLKSAGEFYIKATAMNQPLQLAPGKHIDVAQPLINGPLDTLMNPFVVGDTANNNNNNWVPTALDSLHMFASDYLFSLYQFNSPVDSGSWCNSDNANYFSAFQQTILTMIPGEDPVACGTNVFLLFHGTACMVHVYLHSGSDFPYNYAPQGLQCTAVTIGVKDGDLYASFTPVTISANSIINLQPMTKTTESDFKNQLDALN